MSTVHTLYPDYPTRRAEPRPSPFLGMAIAAAILALAVLANASWGQEQWGRSAFPESDCAAPADRGGKCAPAPDAGARIDSSLTPYGQCAVMPFRVSPEGKPGQSTFPQ